MDSRGPPGHLEESDFAALMGFSEFGTQKPKDKKDEKGSQEKKIQYGCMVDETSMDVPLAGPMPRTFEKATHTGEEATGGKRGGDGEKPEVEGGIEPVDSSTPRVTESILDGGVFGERGGPRIMYTVHTTPSQRSHQPSGPSPISPNPTPRPAVIPDSFYDDMPELVDQDTPLYARPAPESEPDHEGGDDFTDQDDSYPYPEGELVFEEEDEEFVYQYFIPPGDSHPSPESELASEAEYSDPTDLSSLEDESVYPISEYESFPDEEYSDLSDLASLEGDVIYPAPEGDPDPDPEEEHGLKHIYFFIHSSPKPKPVTQETRPAWDSYYPYIDDEYSFDGITGFSIAHPRKKLKLGSGEYNDDEHHNSDEPFSEPEAEFHPDYYDLPDSFHQNADPYANDDDDEKIYATEGYTAPSGRHFTPKELRDYKYGRVFNENGDRVLFQPSFIEDPFKGMRPVPSQEDKLEEDVEKDVEEDAEEDVEEEVEVEDDEDDDDDGEEGVPITANPET